MRIGLLGCGNMGRALVRGLTRESSHEVIGWDIIEEMRQIAKKNIQIIKPESWEDQKPLDVIVVAVKPQSFDSAVSELKSRVSKNSTLWLSIAAGVSIEQIEKLLNPNTPVCRCMPNTPALIGQGMMAYACNASCSDFHKKNAHALLQSVGEALAVPEKLMDAVTGLSGSGPAYVYLFIESLIEGGVSAGLPYDIARKCAVQTVFGASKMLHNNTEIPADLKRKVMSPNGTTVAGLKNLEKNAFKYSIIAAVEEATKRSTELSSKK